jgi:chlorite dismutase
MAQTETTSEDSAPPPPRQFVNYVFFKVDPAWRRLPQAERAQGKEEFARVVEDYRGRALILPFSTMGTRGIVI